MAVTTPYTTEARITRMIGSLGVDLRTDDTAETDDSDDAIQDAIDAGTDDVDKYLTKFSTTSIAANTYCITCATWFAVRALCLRRLNEVPKSVKAECERREKHLELVRQGKARLRLEASRRPVVVTNHVVDLRRFNNKVRVDRNRSTGVAQDYKRPIDETSPDGR